MKTRGKGGRALRTVMVALLLTIILVMAGLSAYAKPPEGKGKPDKETASGIGSISVRGARFDGNIVAWVTMGGVGVYDMGNDGEYKTSDDGKVVNLAPSDATNLRMDISGKYVVWDAQTDDLSTYDWRDVFYYEGSEETVNGNTYYHIGTDDDVGRTWMYTENDWESATCVWGVNMVFTKHGTSQTPGLYIMDLGDGTISRMTTSNGDKARIWEDFVVIQSTWVETDENGDSVIRNENWIYYLGTDHEYDLDGTEDSTGHISALSGYRLAEFNNGYAIYAKDGTDSTDWKYMVVELDGSGDITYTVTSGMTSPYVKFYWGRGVAGGTVINGDYIVYPRMNPEAKSKHLTTDLYLYDMANDAHTKIKTAKNGQMYFAHDIDDDRVLYTLEGHMYFYHFDTGTHEQLS